jgi:hypothetical protein
VREVLVVLDVVGGVVVDADDVRGALHQPGLLLCEVGQPLPDELLHRLRVVAVGDGVQEPGRERFDLVSDKVNDRRPAIISDDDG